MEERILLKRSLVADAVPTIADLKPGELAINVPDGKIYMVQGQESAEDERDITAITTNYVAIDSITSVEEGKATVLLSEYVTVFAGERIMITLDPEKEGHHTFSGLYYIAEVKEGPTKEIVIYADEGAGGTGGEFRIYGEEDDIVIAYAGDVIRLSKGDAIIIYGDEHIYAGIYIVVSQVEGIGEHDISVEGFNHGDYTFLGSELQISKYDYEIVTFYSTSETLKKEIREDILNAIQVAVQRDDNDKITNVRLVDRNIADIPGA